MPQRRLVITPALFFTLDQTMRPEHDASLWFKIAKDWWNETYLSLPPLLLKSWLCNFYTEQPSGITVQHLNKLCHMSYWLHFYLSSAMSWSHNQSYESNLTLCCHLTFVLGISTSHSPLPSAVLSTIFSPFLLCGLWWMGICLFSPFSKTSFTTLCGQSVVYLRLKSLTKREKWA